MVSSPFFSQRRFYQTQIEYVWTGQSLAWASPVSRWLVWQREVFAYGDPDLEDLLYSNPIPGHKRLKEVFYLYFEHAATIE